MKFIESLPACPVETTLMLIGDKWKVLILRDLLPGKKRFGELRWPYIPKGPDFKPSGYGSLRTIDPYRLC